MGNFIGHDVYSIDEKGRFIFPVNMRRQLTVESANTFILTRGMDKCITAYPLDNWQRYKKRFESLNHYDKKSVQFLRILMEYYQEIQLDKQQRLMLPKKHILFLGLKTQILVKGMLDRIELWSPEEYDKYSESSQESFEDIAEIVMSDTDKIIDFNRN